MHDDDPQDFKLVPPVGAAAPPESVEPPGASDTLSPAVRRLVRQYRLDVNTIRGTGPDGRVRVTDVMARIGGGAAMEASADEPDDDRLAGTLTRAPEPASSSADPAAETTGRQVHVAAPTTASTVFEIDVDVLLEHCARRRASGADAPLAAYFAAAALGAIDQLPSLLATQPARLDVLRSGAEDASRATLQAEDLASVDTIANALHRASEDVEPAALALYDYGSSGCLFATALPLAPGQIAMLGIGRPRRRITVREVGGERAPRAVSSCHLTLTYDPKYVTLEQANRFVAAVSRNLPRQSAPE